MTLTGLLLRMNYLVLFIFSYFPNIHHPHFHLWLLWVNVLQEAALIFPQQQAAATANGVGSNWSWNKRTRTTSLHVKLHKSQQWECKKKKKNLQAQCLLDQTLFLTAQQRHCIFIWLIPDVLQNWSHQHDYPFEKNAAVLFLPRWKVPWLIKKKKTLT